MDSKNEVSDAAVEARRRFLATCGKLAIVTPPAVTLILSQAGRNYAVAASGGGGGGNNGWGNGGGDGVPGRSGQNGSPQTPSKVKDKDR